MRFDIEYGNGFLSLDLSRFNNVQTIESKAAAPIPNIQETVHQQIAKTNLFSDLSKLDPANSNLVLLIDTPSRIRYISSMLNPLLKSLRTSTIPSENIQLLVSEPFYRKYTVNRIQDILGPLDLDDVQLYMHNPTNGRQNKLVGNDPAKGFPIHLNKVYERASFRIVVTSVMRSTFFGSTGGYFGIAPGVCGIKTQNNLGRIQAVYESSAFQTHPTFLASAKSITEFAPPSLVFSIVQDAAGISADIFIDRIDTT